MTTTERRNERRNVHVTITRKSDGATVMDTTAALVQTCTHSRKGECMYVALNATWCCDYPLSTYTVTIDDNA